MKMTWALSILIISFVLLAILKAHDLTSLAPFYQSQKTYKLHHFDAAKKDASEQEIELLELWESMLTGRSAPVSRWIKDQYKSLGLNHLFTPSGFHLSAVLLPFMKFITRTKWQLIFLILIGIGIFSLSGQGALKRMVLIKFNQKILGQKTGFALALLLDILFGSFTDSPTSFCYSFLFLGIIYSGSSLLFLWFFFAQGLIAYFSGELISPLIIFLSPILNLAFAMAMPLLFVLAYPLAQWQLFLGIKILSFLQKMVEWSAQLSLIVPSWEFNFGILLCFLLFYSRKRKAFAAAVLMVSFTLNSDSKNILRFGNYDFVPQGKIKKIILNEFGETVYWTDGKCDRELIRGVWWEKCSPSKKKRSFKKNKLKKLSSV